MGTIWGRRRRVTLWVVIACSAIAAWLAPRLFAQESTERIVFETEETGLLATINADGTDLKKVRTGHYSDQDPLWSPDRTKIAFYQGEGDSEVWVSNPDGSDAALVSPGEHEGDGEAWINGFDWSPDSTSIVYSRSNYDGEGGINDRKLVVKDLGSGESKVLMEGETAGEFPAWSPDGSRIAFVSTMDGGNDLFTISPDGSGLTQLTRLPRWSRSTGPVWSPDGARIAYTRRTRGNSRSDIKILDVATGDRTDIGSSEDFQGQPRWSPVGSKLAYLRGIPDGDSNGLVVTDLETGTTSLLLKQGEHGIFFAWSPEGSRIVAAVGGYTIGAHLLVIDVQTAEATDLGKIANGRHLDW